MNDKCIVTGCENHKHQGRFVGDMCSPCYDMITTGKIGPTTSFLNQLENKDKMVIPGWEELFMRHVYLIASKSKDTMTKIGSVIVDNKTIVSEGYNGMAMGVDDKVLTRYERPEKYFWMSHAERNSIFHCARRGVKTENTTLFTQGLPCSDCADAIINSGIKNVVVHAEWEGLWIKISHNKWAESAKRSTMKFKEAGIYFSYFFGHLGCKTLIDGKVYTV
jgi:dCMP deaminase